MEDGAMRLGKMTTKQLDSTFSTKQLHNGKKVKGTYFRRINDIELALDKFGADQLSTPAKFVAYYWGCEKLGKAIVGIASERPASEQFPEDMSGPPMDNVLVQKKLSKLNIQFDDGRLKLLFEPQKNVLKPTSAMRIRNRLFHDFGPTQVDHVVKNARTLFPIMVDFLNLRSSVIAHLKSLQHRVADPPA
jgi:hypothetical protein